METIQETKKSHSLLPKFNGNLVTFIIPTLDNQGQLVQCLQSLKENTLLKEFKVLIANNGTTKILNSLMDGNSWIEVHDMGSNLGWEGGINALLPLVDTPFVCLLNDDTFFPPNDPIWLNKMLCEFRDPKVGAVGPSSNYVMQKQNMFWPNLPRKMQVPVLIGLCLMTRTDLLKELGGLGKDLPGGDDLDLSMRLETAGYKLICLRSVFIYHHGAQTGRKVHGAYWDSELHQDRTNIELIRRNGLKKFMRCRYGDFQTLDGIRYYNQENDAEGNLIKKHVFGDRVIEMGCGDSKTINTAIGVDIVCGGDVVKTIEKDSREGISVADIQSSVDDVPIQNESFDCVIARHILEHMIDPIKTLKEWDRILTSGGRLIVALPDQDISNTIPLNPEHVHAYTKDSFRSLMSAILPNYKEITNEYANNGVSFVAVYEKN